MNKSIASRYDLSCGCFDRVTYEEIQTTLWREHAVYHVRTYDFRDHALMSWKSYRLLSVARREYAKQARNAQRQAKGRTSL